MAKLVCQSGPKAGHEYPLDKDVVSLGRQSSCDIQVMDTMSSRLHCQIRRDGKLYTLVDCGSRNGTQLNDKKVTERQLCFGDRVRIGEVEFLLVKENGDVELKDLLSKYDVGEKLGEGGMGIVFKATQRSMARTVALKILSPKYASKQRYVEQFIREARAAGQLNHPNIIQVHDVGTENGIHYFSMEYVDGPTCMQALKGNGPFPVPEALEITRQTAKALEYAHAHRLIHQDIKPDNIMMTPGNQVKLADLGISKTFDEAENEDGPKKVMGTPHYMAPEAALGKKIDHRVDIYSLGATLYHLLTGKTPFAGTSATEVLKAHVMDPLPAVQDLNPEVPDDVCALVERMMAKKPDDRYQTAASVAEEIHRLQSGLKLGTDRIAPTETMILRRLAKGTPTSAPTPGPQTAVAAGRGRASAMTTTGSRRHVGAERLASRLRAFFILTLVVVLLFVAVVVAQRMRPDRGTAPTAAGEQPAVATTGPAEQPAETIKPPTEDPRAAEARAKLSAVDDRLRQQGVDADLAQVLAQLDEIDLNVLDAASRARAQQTRANVKQLLERRAATVKEQAIAELEGGVKQLVDERNYELALSRIEAFAHKDDPAAATRLTALREKVQRGRDGFLAELRGRVAASKNDLARLRQLRDQLPKAVLGTDLEQELAKAIEALEQQEQARHQELLAQVAGELTKWNLDRVAELHRLHRATLGDGPQGQQLDQFLAGASRLRELAAAMGTKIAATDPRPVYRGQLHIYDRPMITSADLRGLQLQPPDSSGSVELRWQQLDEAALRDVVKLVLREQAGDFAGAIDTLAAARGAIAGVVGK